MPINRKTKWFFAFYEKKIDQPSSLFMGKYLPDLINIISLITISCYNAEYFR